MKFMESLMDDNGGRWALVELVRMTRKRDEWSSVVSDVT